MKKTFLLVVSLYILLVSCSLFKDESPREDIIGEWKLVEYYSYWFGRTFDADSAGLSVRVIYHPDSMYYRYWADSLDQVGTFTTTKDNEDRLFIDYEIYSGPYFGKDYVEFISSNRIIIYNQCIDCANYTYRRIK